MSISEYLPSMPLNGMALDNCLESIHGSCPAKFAYRLVSDWNDAPFAFKAIISGIAFVALVGIAASVWDDYFQLDEEASWPNSSLLSSLADTSRKAMQVLLDPPTIPEEEKSRLFAHLKSTKSIAATLRKFKRAEGSQFMSYVFALLDKVETSGDDSACALHALLGEKRGGCYRYPAGGAQARKDFVAELKSRIDEDDIFKSYYHLVSDMAQEASFTEPCREVEIFSGMIPEEVTTFNGCIDDVDKDYEEALHEYYQAIYKNFQLLPISVQDKLRNVSEARIKEFVSTLRSKYKVEEFVKACKDVKIKGIDWQVFSLAVESAERDYKEVLDEQKGLFASKETVKNAYYESLQTSGYQLVQRDLQLAAKLYNKQLYILNDYGLETDSFSTDLPEGDIEEVYIHRQDSVAHFSRFEIRPETQAVLDEREEVSGSDSDTSIGDTPPRSVDSSPEMPRRLEGTKEENIGRLQGIHNNLQSKEVNAVEQLRSERGAKWIEYGERILNDFGYDQEVMRIVGVFTNIRNNWMRFDFSPLDSSLLSSRKAQKIPDDQNCLFHAVALSYRQVTGKSLQDDTATPHVNLRKQCKEYLTQNSQDPRTMKVLEHALEDERAQQIESTNNDILCYEFLLGEDPDNRDKKTALEVAKTKLQKLQDESNGLIRDHIEEVGQLGRMGGIAETYAAAQHLQVPIVLCNVVPGCPEKKYVYGAEHLNAGGDDNNILVIEYVSQKSHYNNRKLTAQERQNLFNQAERMDPAIDSSSSGSSPEHLPEESEGESDD